jgi:gas vesicle protein
MIMLVIAEVAQFIHDTKEKISNLKEWLSTKWENFKTDASNAWKKIKEFITTPVKAAYDSVREKIDALRTWINDKWETIKSRTSQAWDRIKDYITTPISNAKRTLEDKVGAIKDWILRKWDDIKDTTGRKWDQIVDKILSPIRNLKEKIRDIIDDIEDLFDINIPEPNIPVPHFVLSPSWWTFSDLFDGVIPDLDIDWWAKGGIFKKPTLLGGGNGVGEAGPEAVLPLDQLWSQLNNMSNSIVNGILIGMQQQQQTAQQSGDIHLDVYLYPSGPKMGEQVVNAYDRYKPVYG